MGNMLLTTTQLIERANANGIKFSRYTLQRWISAQAFPVIKSGNRIYIYWPHFLKFIKGDDDQDA